MIYVNRQCRWTPSIITIATWTRLTVVLCFKMPEWLDTDITRLSFALAKNEQLFFQRFGSMQLPSSGNDDKEKHSCI